MKHISRKVVAAALVMLAGLLILLSLPIPKVQSQLPVDVAITSITNVDGMVVYFSGMNKTINTNITIDVRVERLDSQPIPSVLVNLTLTRTDNVTSENTALYNTTILVPPLGTVKLPLYWNETLGKLSPGTYDVHSFADVISDGTIYDSNMTNNFINAGRVRVFVVKEDLDGDGIVGVKDSMLMASAFGWHGPPGSIPQDLMPDGVVDSFDVQMLLRMFGWTIQNPIPPKPVTWTLTITTYGGNYTVEVFSDYIVYSEYSFNKTLKQLNFNVTSSIDALCNVTIPKGLMSGACTVYLDDLPTPSIITWNATHYFVYFNSTGLSHKVRIEAEFAVPIVGDLNHDEIVDIYDAILLANHYNQHN
jgi:hypothetical protein